MVNIEVTFALNNSGLWNFIIVFYSMVLPNVVRIGHYVSLAPIKGPDRFYEIPPITADYLHNRPTIATSILGTKSIGHQEAKLAAGLDFNEL